MRLTKLTEGEHKSGSTEESLAQLVDAASAEAQTPRLDGRAHARIEARLAGLEQAGSGSIGFGWRMPAFALAGAAAAFVLVWVARPSTPNEVVAVAPSVPALRAAGPLPSLHGAQLALVGPGRVEIPADVQLAEGTLSVRSDQETIVVRTPTARVEVAAHSIVEIAIAGRGVRIAAELGSAQVVYFDGRTELVEPASRVEHAAIAPAVEVPAGEAAVEAPARPGATRHVGKATKPVATPVAEPAAVEPTTVVPQVEAPTPIPAVAPPAPSALGTESAQLGEALAKMRDEPKEALALLDEHLSRYPRGALRPEAERARVALLLKLGRKAEALVALDKISSPPAELRVVRAELRADMGRCDEAIGDFGVALTLDDDRFGERALFGRAMCRQRLGDKKRMKEDLERYLVLHPRGTFSDKARLELERLEDAAR